MDGGLEKEDTNPAEDGREGVVLEKDTDFCVGAAVCVPIHMLSRPDQHRGGSSCKEREKEMKAAMREGGESSKREGGRRQKRERGRRERDTHTQEDRKNPSLQEERRG